MAWKRKAIENEEALKTVRLSPSSLNTFRHCPRKWFYEYIQAVTSGPTIHTLRGSAVHEVLEEVFKTRSFPSGEAFREAILGRGKRLFDSKWKEHLEDFEFDEDRKEIFRVESRNMIVRFFTRFCDNIQQGIANGDYSSERQGFYFTRPTFKEQWVDDQFQTDWKWKQLKDEEGNKIPMDTTLNVGGFIDSILKDFDGNYTLIDYKTSKKYKGNLNPEYVLQLGIYAYLFQKQRGFAPSLVGVNYLKYDESFYLKVTPSLIQEAVQKILEMRAAISEWGFDKEKYFKHEGKLCEWCGAYDKCFPKELEEKEEEVKDERN